VPWLYFLLTLPVAIITGFAAFSRGAVFQRAAGQIIQGVLSIICFGFIVWAFWHYGWKAGLAELFVVFIGANIGQLILNSVAR
jgi:ABC-type uncharacterized transport system permease subunit